MRPRRLIQKGFFFFGIFLCFVLSWGCSNKSPEPQNERALSNLSQKTNPPPKTLTTPPSPVVNSVSQGEKPRSLPPAAAPLAAAKTENIPARSLTANTTQNLSANVTTFSNGAPSAKVEEGVTASGGNTGLSALRFTPPSSEGSLGSSPPAQNPPQEPAKPQVVAFSGQSGANLPSNNTRSSSSASSNTPSGTPAITPFSVSSSNLPQRPLFADITPTDAKPSLPAAKPPPPVLTLPQGGFRLETPIINPQIFVAANGSGDSKRDKKDDKKDGGGSSKNKEGSGGQNGEGSRSSGRGSDGSSGDSKASSGNSSGGSGTGSSGSGSTGSGGGGGGGSETGDLASGGSGSGGSGSGGAGSGGGGGRSGGMGSGGFGSAGSGSGGAGSGEGGGDGAGASGNNSGSGNEIPLVVASNNGTLPSEPLVKPMDHCTGCYTLAFVGEADSFNLDSPLRNFPDGVVLRLQNNSQGEKEYLPCTTECEGAKVRVLHFNRYEPMWFQYGPKIFYSSFISYGGKYNWPYLGASQYWEFTVGEYKDGKNVSMNSLKTNKDGFYLITLAFPPKNSSSGSSNSAAPRPSAPPSASYGGSDLLVRSLTDVSMLQANSHANLLRHESPDGGVPINRSPSNLVAASSMVYLNSSSSALLSLLGADGSREITTPEAFESLTQQMKFDEFLRVVHILPSIDPAGHLVPEDSNIRVLLPLK